MFTRQMAVALAFFLGVGSATALAQLNSKSGRVAPLSARDKALRQCELHSIPLRLGTASILYGKRNLPIPQLIAKRQFPRASSALLGGCVISKNSPTRQQVKFCPKCRAAEQHWLIEKHRIAPPPNQKKIYPAMLDSLTR